MHRCPIPLNLPCLKCATLRTTAGYEKWLFLTTFLLGSGVRSAPRHPSLGRLLLLGFLAFLDDFLLGVHSEDFSHYVEMPRDAEQKVIEESKKAKQQQAAE